MSKQQISTNMKKTNFAISLAFIILGAIACQTTEFDINAESESPAVAEPCEISCTMNATMPEFQAGGDPETKTSLESVVRVKWKKNDELSVINLTTGKQLGGCIKADKDGANSTFSPSGLNGSITAGDKLVFLLDNDPNHRSATEKDFETFTMDYSSQKGNSNEVPIVVYANYTATENGTINAVNPEFNFLMGYVQLAVSSLPASTSVTELGIENLNTKCHFNINNHEFVITPQNGDITLSEAFTANSKGTNTRYFSCFTSPAQNAARNAHIHANSQIHVTAWLKAALSAGYYYQSVATGFTNENISFVDDAFKSYCVSHYDMNGDGEVSFAEAAAVTSFESFTATEKNSIKEVFELPYFFKGERIPSFEGCTALKQIILPGTLETIQENAFKGCTGLEVITIPSTVTTIGEGAFEGCTSLARFDGAYASADRRFIVRDNHVLAFAPAGLTETTIPDGVTTINAGVFANNTSLKTVYLSAELTTVQARAFKGCTALPIIRFRTQIASIGEEAFKGCSALRSVYCDAVTPPSIGTDAFANCHASIAAHVTSGNLEAYEANSAWSALHVSSGQPWNEIWYTTVDGEVCNTDIGFYTSNTYVDGKGILSFNVDLTSLQGYAFAGIRITPNLETISLPASVATIGSFAFLGHSTLTSITIPEGVESIGQKAFNGCSSLTDIVIPESVTSIGGSAFSGCSSLVSIILPPNITSLDNWCFNNCNSLTSVTLPESLESLGTAVFEGCSALESIVLPEGLLTLGGQVFHNCFLLSSITIPNSVQTIGNYAFWNNYALTSVTIPDSIQSISISAFSGCRSLSVVYADPSALARTDFISDYNYSLYTNNQNPQLVTEIVIPDTVTTVTRAFSHCTSIMSVTIPSSVQSIDSNAFNYCKNLSTVFIKALTPPACNTGAFSSTVSNIYVPTSSVDAYKEAWPNYAAIISGYDFE